MKKGTEGHSKRIDPADFGVDLAAIAAEIRGAMADKSNAEIAAEAGMSATVVAQLFNGIRPVSLGALCALADVAGGSIEVKFKKRKRVT